MAKQWHQLERLDHKALKKLQLEREKAAKLAAQQELRQKSIIIGGVIVFVFVLLIVLVITIKNKKDAEKREETETVKNGDSYSTETRVYYYLIKDNGEEISTNKLLYERFVGEGIYYAGRTATGKIFSIYPDKYFELGE